MRRAGPCLRSRAVLDLILLAAYLSFAPRGGAQETWLPIPPEDLALQDNPAAPGSSAMILYKEELRDDADRVRRLYYRIKIFTDAGRQYADIQIPYLRGRQEVKDIAARTVLPDGSSVEFRGPVYENTVMGQGKQRLLAKTFTLPEVQSGSIVEYRFRLETKNYGDYESHWPVQEPLFVREARLFFRPGPGSASWSVHGRLLPEGADFRENQEEKNWQATVRNLSAFETEPYMPPAWQSRAHYHVVYVSPYESSLQDLALYVERYIGNPRSVRDIVLSITAPGEDSETKLRKIYTQIQRKIRNLSYEEMYTKKESKQEGLKERKSPKEVWEYGYGTADEITFLFVALCLAAEIPAGIMFVTQRDVLFYDEAMPLLPQLSGQIAYANAGGRTHFLDPGTRFAPFGHISWENQGGKAVRVEYSLEGRREWSWHSDSSPAPQEFADENIRHRRIRMDLEANGDSMAQVEVEYRGQEAIARRNELFGLSDQERERQARKDLETLFPTGTLGEIVWSGVDEAGDSVRLSYALELPGFAATVGERLLVRPWLHRFASPFSHAKRRFAVYFPFPYKHSEEIRITLPEGFELERSPRAVRIIPGPGLFETVVLEEEAIVQIQKRLLLVDYQYEDPQKFSELKQFFDLIQAEDQRYLVLRRR